MMPLKRLNLNLASEPLLNRRLFRILFWTTAGAFLGLSLLSAILFLSFRSRAVEAQAALHKAERMIETAQKEKIAFAAQSQEASQKYQEQIDLINSLILKKSFSWIDLFSLLEDSLPASCYIVSLSPVQVGEQKIELRFKVASPALNGLLELINNLNARRFTNITVKNETKDSGELISEISVSHERSI